MVVLYESNSWTVVTVRGAYIIDKSTGKIIKFFPDMEPTMESLNKNIEILTAVSDLLEITEEFKDKKELHELATKALSLSAEGVEIAVKGLAKPSRLE